ncbi:MAG: cobalamin-dependent protein [Pseudomonadota bacterium]
MSDRSHLHGLADPILRDTSDRTGAWGGQAEMHLGVLLDFALARTERDLATTLDHLRQSGLRTQDLVDVYIPKAARLMGDQWCSDGMGFADVSIGSARLMGLLRRIERAESRADTAHLSAPTVLVCVADGEQHVMGAMTVAMQVRRLGLDCRVSVGDTLAQCRRALSTGHIDAVFVSVSSTERLVPVRKLVENIRECASRPLRVVAGGSVAEECEELKSLTGVDFVSSDAAAAVRRCGLTPFDQHGPRAATVT